tara:strand:- start:482 stop:793 length:312 start_codon:yes stop_codon:yes gene_type:complete
MEYKYIIKYKCGHNEVSDVPYLEETTISHKDVNCERCNDAGLKSYMKQTDRIMRILELTVTMQKQLIFVDEYGMAKQCEEIVNILGKLKESLETEYKWKLSQK